MEQRPDLSDNPFLKIENPWEQTEAARAKAEEELKEFQRLCYSVWMSYADGKALWERLQKQYLMQQQLDPAGPNAQSLAVWWDGFKAALLMMHNFGLTHLKRINGVTNE